LRLKRLKRLRDRENYLRDTKKVEPDPAMALIRVYNSMAYTIFSQQGFYCQRSDGSWWRQNRHHIFIRWCLSAAIRPGAVL